MSSKYYKVISDTLYDFVEDWNNAYNTAIDAARRFSRRQGGHRKDVGIARIFGVTRLSIVFSKEPNPKLWKKTHRDSDQFWVPRGRTKLHKELVEIESFIPSTTELEKAIGFDAWSERSYRSIGMKQLGDEYILILPHRYTPSDPDLLRHISDIEFEELCDAM